MATLRVLIFIVLCFCTLSDTSPNTTANTTGSPFLVCPSQCSKFFSNSKIFPVRFDMVKNFTVTAFTATKFTDVIEAFVSYSYDFIKLQLQNLLALNTLSQYRNQIYQSHNASALDRFDNFYGGNVCPPCSDSIQQNFDNGIPAVPNLLEEETIADNLEVEIATKPKISLSIKKYPAWTIGSRRLLYPLPGILPPTEQYEACISDYDDRLWQAECLLDLETKYQAHRGYYFSKLKPETTGGNSQNVKVSNFDWSTVTEEQILGYASVLIHGRFKNAITDAFQNCFAGQVLATCI